MRAKLVRDDCNAVREGQAQAANSVQGKHMALLLKLNEETDEIARAACDPYEYADLLEALFELAKLNGVDFDSIVRAMEEKRGRLGGFENGMIWSVDVPAKPKLTFPTTGVLPHPSSVEGQRRQK